jgi:hypothetical protein
MSTRWVTVRQDFAAADLLAQHEMTGYQQTAFEIDSQPANAGLDKMRHELAGFAGKNAGQAYYFELARVP